MSETVETDVAIVGSGMGGSVLARGLAEQGIASLVIERGTYLPREPENWQPEHVFQAGRYKPQELWWDVLGKRWFHPGVHYVVGGNTKVYGASLPRFREQDFDVLEHAEGSSPAWPFAYADLEPWYGRVENMFDVHGSPGADPTEPWRSSPYPYPALAHDTALERVVDGFKRLGLHPSFSAMGLDRRQGGACILCPTCDGFPCQLGAKSDAERSGLTPALESGNTTLLDHTRITSLVTDRRGRKVVSAVGTRNGESIEIRARTFVLSAGAVNSAALLLASANDQHPNGLANSSGQVGRNYMVHNATFTVAVDPRRKNDVSFQKTLMVNDWYLDGPEGHPLGNIQMLGKLRGATVKAAVPLVPLWALDKATSRSWDFYLESEDLPDPDNRVTVGPGGRIEVRWRPNNMTAHRGLVHHTKGALKAMGFPIVRTQTMGIETNSHQCGTCVAGTDPTTSVLDPLCRTHDVDNLLVVDSSYFPSCAAVNPALTIAAQALRVAHQGDVLR